MKYIKDFVKKQERFLELKRSGMVCGRKVKFNDFKEWLMSVTMSFESGISYTTNMLYAAGKLPWDKENDIEFTI